MEEDIKQIGSELPKTVRTVQESKITESVQETVGVTFSDEGDDWIWMGMMITRSHRGAEVADFCGGSRKWSIVWR